MWCVFFFFFKQKTAYEMRISDWSSDVCSSDLGEYESYLAIFPGEALYRMYEEFGPRLLEYNVRAFLQATGKVNRGIRDTLRDEPHHFMAYNNGISVTVDEITDRKSTRLNSSH